MSVTFPRYPQSGYPIQNQTLPSPFQALPPRVSSPWPNPIAPDAANQHFSNQAYPTLEQSPSPTPDVSKRWKAAGIAVALIIPAIVLARIAPSELVKANAAKELLPSDWKVWAKIGLGIGSISQANKALNWNPPPWLGAFMNVSIMAALMTGFTRNSARTIAILGPWVAALVQGTAYANQKLEKPLQGKFNIPPVATKLGLSVLSMGAGFAGLPKLMTLAESEAAAGTAAKEASKTRAVATGGCACCGGSPICFTELANNATLAMTHVQKQLTNQKSERDSQ